MGKATKRSIIAAAVALVLVAFAMWVRYADREGIISCESSYVRGAIYVVLLSAWGYSVYLRIVQTHVRRYLLAVSALMVVWVIIRTIKYTVSDVDLTRRLWYLFYLPMIFIPLLSLFISISLSKAESYRPPRWTWAMYFIAGILLALVITNDRHELVFTYPNGIMSDRDYEYAAGYYIIAAWEVLCAVAAITIMLFKCRLPHSRRYLVFPLIPLALSVAYAYAYITDVHWVWVIAGDVTIAQCITFTSVFESCIQCGLIQSNIGYDELFEAAALHVQITDETMRIKHSTAAADPLSEDELRQMKSDTVLLNENTLLNRHRLRRGYVFWKEDISELNEIRSGLEEAQEELRDMGNILEAEKKQQARLLRLADENLLYDMMEEQTSAQTAMVRERLTKLQNTDDIEFAKRLLGQIIVIGTYIKRRNNLIFVGMQRGIISAQELSLCLNESAENLTLYGVDCKVIVKCGSQLTVRQATEAYDLFEATVEAGIDSLDSILLSIEGEERPDVNICAECGHDLSGLEGLFPQLKTERDDDGLQYLSLRLEKS